MGIGLPKLREDLAENNPEVFQPQLVNALIYVRMGRWNQFDQAGETIGSKVQRRLQKQLGDWSTAPDIFYIGRAPGLKLSADVEILRQRLGPIGHMTDRTAPSIHAEIEEPSGLLLIELRTVTQDVIDCLKTQHPSSCAR